MIVEHADGDRERDSLVEIADRGQSRKTEVRLIEAARAVGDKQFISEEVGIGVREGVFVQQRDVEGNPAIGVRGVNRVDQRVDFALDDGVGAATGLTEVGLPPRIVGLIDECRRGVVRQIGRGRAKIVAPAGVVGGVDDVVIVVVSLGCGAAGGVRAPSGCPNGR